MFPPLSGDLSSMTCRNVVCIAYKSVLLVIKVSVYMCMYLYIKCCGMVGICCNLVPRSYVSFHQTVLWRILEISCGGKLLSCRGDCVFDLGVL